MLYVHYISIKETETLEEKNKHKKEKQQPKLKGEKLKTECDGKHHLFISVDPSLFQTDGDQLV